jgi:signal transduction histidine kinase
LRRQPNFVVQSVPNGLLAVEYCLENDIDLVLMDVMMPVMDGNTATTKLRQTFSQSQLPIIMVTTLSDVDNLVSSFEAGANDYVTKPIEWNALKARISTGLNVRDSMIEQERLTEKTQVLNQRLKQFSFAVAHDIRNPLAHIQVLCNAFSESLMEADDVVEQVDQLAEKISLFMDSLLEHSTYGKSEDVGNVDGNEILLQVEKFLGPVIEEKGAEITSDELPVLRVSHGLLFQLLLNLVGNSLKYCHPDRSVQIMVNRVDSGRYVGLEVVDNGLGMSTSDLEVVKKPLTRGQSSEGTDGVGLGLSLAKNIMDEFGGELLIESEEGKGTRIKMLFSQDLVVTN